MSVAFSFGAAAPIAPVGTSTHSESADFYVYEWVIRETGEIFYVGKGRGNRAFEHHYNNEDAERLRTAHETDVIFVATDLTEAEALILETEEILRIKSETPWVLANVSMPQGLAPTRGPSGSTPALCFETAPKIYSTDVDEHYFDRCGRAYDEVDLSALKSVYIEDRMLWHEVDEVVYGGKYGRYFEETVSLLKQHGARVLSTKYAKSVSAWIYVGQLSLWLYEDDQSKAMERIGRHVTALHLIDVWKALRSAYGQPVVKEEEAVEIRPINSRIPLTEVPRFSDFRDTYSVGREDLEKGFEYYWEKEYDKAITCFDKARSKGCIDPCMYNYYAIMFRRAKDYDNEIDILNEALEMYEYYDQECYSSRVLDFKKRREKAASLLKKARSKG